MHQITLFPNTADTFTCSDDWETPDRVSRQIAALVRSSPHGLIVEPSAGTGQIVRNLPLCTAIELNRRRYDQGKKDWPGHQWLNENFLLWTPPEPVDVVVGNPPFSLWGEFLVHALEILRPGGCVFFVGPCDTFHKPTMLDRIRRPVAIVPHPIVGRVAYLRDGVAVVGRQVYDSIFEVRLNDD
jgi:hypothetical protein